MLSKGKNNTSILLLLSVLSGLIFGLSWPPLPLTFLIFLAFVPLLEVHRRLSAPVVRRSNLKFFLYCFLSFLIWNVITTWWIWNASSFGAVFAVTANALLMCLPMLLFKAAAKRRKEAIGFIAFAVFWLGFEYLHLNWELSWPWLTLGNVFARRPSWVQWYEYTGVLGGSLWVLLANVILYKTFTITRPLWKNHRRVLKAGLAVGVPMAVSFIIGGRYKEKGNLTEVVVVQPNVNPYTEKFEGSDQFIPLEKQVDRLIELSEQKITSQTRYVIWPETAISTPTDERNPTGSALITKLSAFVGRYPNTSLITGINSFTVYPNRATATARYHETLGYYDIFNTAMQIDASGKILFYHKAKLVLGVEKMPFISKFKFLESLALNMGGTSGSLGAGEERTVFRHTDAPGAAAPVCYESVYGEFMAGFVRNGADLLFIITNDGWWGNTAGYRQHFQYANLRAIETRRSIARAANTGISGFIDQRGRVIEKSKWWRQTVLQAMLRANKNITFYVKHGDYLGRIALLISMLNVLGLIAEKFFLKVLRRNRS